MTLVAVIVVYVDTVVTTGEVVLETVLVVVV